MGSKNLSSLFFFTKRKNRN